MQGYLLAVAYSPTAHTRQISVGRIGAANGAKATKGARKSSHQSFHTAVANVHNME